jgi:hypothetical protein
LLWPVGSDLRRRHPSGFEAHIRCYYTDQATLEFIVDGNDVDHEISLLAHDAA